MEFKSIKELIEFRGENNSSELFIFSPEDETKLTFGEYYKAIANLSNKLINKGLKKGDKVAILLFNGLNYAVSFMSVVTGGGVVVPINPNLKSVEIEYLLKDSDAKFIITDIDAMKDLNSKELDFKLEGLNTEFDSSGELKIIQLSKQFEDIDDTINEDLKWEDEVLLLYTSGTTGRPKGVVLTNGNLLSEAENVHKGHKLTQNDIALCVLPLFHVNGLVVTLISPLFSAGKVVMPKKFRASQFWNWIEYYKVTWFSVVPTILSIILSKPIREEIDLSSLRFARSASSSLPVAILNEFENRFGIPVIESYGISEASSQVTTNPLPPLVRKAGSVGLPVGNEIKVIDENGNALKSSVVGEVVIRGDNVSNGYRNNLNANLEAFKNGWFYTGDLGYFDEDGYLFLTGRRKEIINRAGEKISPREVDEVLYSLPEVEMAAAVGVPDPFYGEEVVAFIKLRPVQKIDEKEILSFCSNKLADFKLPKKIFFVEDLPKGPSGKIQRKKLVKVYENIQNSEKGEEFI